MTVPTNTYSRYGAIGVREDLADVIYDISPTDTPIMSSIGKARATQANHEWQTDALAAATTLTPSSSLGAASGIVTGKQIG